MNLAQDMKTDTIKVVASGLMLIGDTFKQETKQEEENIPFISHHNITQAYS